MAHGETSLEMPQGVSRIRIPVPSLAAVFVPSPGSILVPSERAENFGITKVFQSVASMRVGFRNANGEPSVRGTTGS